MVAVPAGAGEIMHVKRRRRRFENWTMFSLFVWGNVAWKNLDLSGKGGRSEGD